MRKLVWFSAAFAAAALSCAYLLDWRQCLWPAAVCILAAPLGLLLRGDARRRAVLVALGLGAGFGWFFGWSALVAAPAEELVGASGTVTVTALDYVVPTDTGGWVDVRLEGVTARLYLRGDCPEISPGDRLTGEMELSASDWLYGESNTYYTSRGIFLLAYAQSEELTVEHADAVPLFLLPRVWAKALKNALDGLYSAGTAALLKAVVLGDKTGLADGQLSLFNRAGLSHLLVVSGLHMSLLLAFLVKLLKNRRVLLAPIALPVLLLMVLLVGGTPSAIRAAVMSGLTLLAPVLRRDPDRPTALLAALLLLLLLDPYSAANVSLQLSFASVAGILLCTDRLETWLTGRLKDRKGLLPRLGRWAGTSLSVTLGAMVFTVPLIALWFGTVSLMAPVSNLLCLWAVGPLYLCALFSGVLALISPWLALPLALPAAGLARFLLWMSERLGTPVFAALSLSSVYYKLWLAAVYALLAAGVLLRRHKKRLLVPLCAPVVLLCAAALFTRLSVTWGTLTVTALDVGQGSATAFCSDGAAVLVDCGGSCSEGAGDVAADYFQSMGETTLDLLVLTHLDGDHYNGVEELFARMEIKAVAIPQGEDEYGRREELERLAREEGAEVWTITAYTQLTMGSCTVCLYPPTGAGSANESGLFFLCSMGDFDVLVTGDAGQTQELALLRTYPLPDLELLIVGHHGSYTSTSEVLLRNLDPEYAFISVGYNSYGHPHQVVLDRLEQAGVEVWRTDQWGSVCISVGEDGAVSVSFP